MKANKQSILLLLAFAVFVTGCTQTDAVVGLGDGTDEGELVAVQMTFEDVPMRSPLSDTRSNGSAVQSRTAYGTREGSVKMELVETPEKSQTRASESEYTNLWILQFDGQTASSKLKYKRYVSAAPFTNLQLITGISQRVVAVANLPATAFDSYVVGITTFDMLATDGKNLDGSANGALYIVGSDNFVPKCGFYDGDILPGKNILISMSYSLAKVNLQISLGSDFSGISFESWKTQLVDVPAKLSWLGGEGGSLPFPAAPVSTLNYTEDTRSYSVGAPVQVTYYLPVNMRGTVPGTTAKLRRTEAPEYATYAKIIGKTTTGDYYYYYLHLGGNFTDDYNLKPNYNYTYKLTLYPDPDGMDSRVEMIRATDISLVGRFGGKLKKGAGGVWQFEKDLWATKKNDGGGMSWGPINLTTGVSDLYDGKGNTLKMAQLGQASSPATWVCWSKNKLLAPSLTTVSDRAYNWYLPAHFQLLGLYVVSATLGDAFNNMYYWSSSEYTPSNTFATYFDYGHIAGATKTDSGYYVRCVEER